MKGIEEAINNLAGVLSSIYEHKVIMRHGKADLKDYRDILKENLAVNLILFEEAM